VNGKGKNLLGNCEPACMPGTLSRRLIITPAYRDMMEIAGSRDEVVCGSAFHESED
jgi:hypothetical protein